MRELKSGFLIIDLAEAESCTMASATFLAAFASDDATVATSSRSFSGLTCDAAADWAGQAVPLATRAAHAGPLVHLLAIAASTTDSRLYPNFLTASQQLTAIASGEDFEHSNRTKCESLPRFCAVVLRSRRATRQLISSRAYSRLLSLQLLTLLGASLAFLWRSDSRLLGRQFFAR